MRRGKLRGGERLALIDVGRGRDPSPPWVADLIRRGLVRVVESRSVIGARSAYTRETYALTKRGEVVQVQLARRVKELIEARPVYSWPLWAVHSICICGRVHVTGGMVGVDPYSAEVTRSLFELAARKGKR